LSAGQPVNYDIETAEDAEFGEVIDADTEPLARYVPDRPLEHGWSFGECGDAPPSVPCSNPHPF
jgi:hypothetical protein